MALEQQSRKLLNYLLNTQGCSVTAGQLAAYMQVSTRQIRNYISDINNLSPGSPVINSTNRGYFLNQQRYMKYISDIGTKSLDSPVSRQKFILQKLISTDSNIDIFDLSDEIHVSIPTIENDIKCIRKRLFAFSLSVRRSSDFLVLEGEESSKRRLINSILRNDSYDSFLLKNELCLLSIKYDHEKMKNEIMKILSANGLITNDYNLNTVILHLIILIDRIRNNNVLSKASYADLSGSPIYQAIKDIRHFLIDDYEIALNEAEFDNLHLIIYNNVTLPIASDSTLATASYIGEIYLEITRKLLYHVSENYYLDKFEEPFVSQFAIHIKNLFLRAKNNYQAKNPLTQRIKMTCPLIYDISVFIAQKLHTEYRVLINEDEIAFISFHIGGYFENNLQYHNRLTCLFIYADYYNMHIPVFEKIMEKFGSHIIIKNSVSANHYSSSMSADFIISTIEIPFTKEHIIISPMLTLKDMEHIENKIRRLRRQKECELAKRMLATFFHSSLFCRLASIPDKFETLAMLAEQTFKKGYTSEAFKEDIIMREKASSTAYYQIAIPHNMLDTVYENSISIVLLDKPARWDDGKDVSIILLLGINQSSKKYFAQIFDFLVEVLSEAEYVRRLAGCPSFTEFIETLYGFIDETARQV